MKDNFSRDSKSYARYRPQYPWELIEFITSLVAEKKKAWDCGTGNGQMAALLSNFFDEVYGTDISQSQIDNTKKAANIYYSVQPAEKANFPNSSFNLVTVAQAIHWFNFEDFFAEVKRVARQHSIIAIVGYGGVSVSEGIDKLKIDFYKNIIGSYWDKERKHIDNNYSTIPFPFAEIKCPEFSIKLNWSFEEYTGYINTWSAVQKFADDKGYNPVTFLAEKIKPLWGNEEMREIKFPIFLRVGKITPQ